MTTIYLPAGPDYIVQEREGAAMPPDVAQELCRLGATARYGPWKLLQGKYEGDDWLVASFGNAQKRGPDGMATDEDANVYVTTDHVRASELDQDAYDDAEWCVRARRLLPKLCNLLMERIGEQPKGAPSGRQEAPE